jgi:hypothetical protein
MHSDGSNPALHLSDSQLTNLAPRNSTMIVVVSTNNPTETQTEVANFLVANNLKHVTNTEPASPLGLAVKQQVQLQRQNGWVNAKDQNSWASADNISFNSTQAPANVENVIVVRGVNRWQATELRESLARPADRKIEYFYDDGSLSAAATSSPISPSTTFQKTSDSSILTGASTQPGDLLPRLNDSPLRQAGITANPTTHPVNTIASMDLLSITISQPPAPEEVRILRVRDDGTIQVSSADSIRAAGLTPADLEKALTQQLSQSDSTTPTQVSVRKLDLTATPRSARTIDLDRAGRSEADSTAQDQIAAASTQPSDNQASPTTYPADAAAKDESLDVVIVLANTELATTLPSSQPSSDPPKAQ